MQLALSFDYPPNPAAYGTEAWWVYELLTARGEACGKDFEDNPDRRVREYRSRVAKLKHMMPAGWTIHHRRQHGSKYVFYSIGRE